MLYRDLILKLLLYLPPETAQNVAERILRCKAPWILIGKYINQDIPELNTEVCGISLSSPIGLAAGFDKEDIWDIGAITAFFALSNRIANFSSMRPNGEFFAMGRGLSDSS